MEPNELIERLQWRYATKAFDPNKVIPDSILTAIEDSLVLTPSSFGLQPWKFLIISDPEIKQALLPHSWNQQQVIDCSHLVVLTAKSPIGDTELDTFIDRTHQVRGGEKESLQFYRDMMGGFVSNMSDEQLLVWAKNQVYIALGQLMTSAAMLGIDACPMEGITPAEYDKILKLEGTGYYTTLACPLGYRAEEDKYASLPKVRYGKSEIVEHL